MLILQALMCIERHDPTSKTIWNYATGTLTTSKAPDTMLSLIHLNGGELRTHASCKTTRTQESFDHQGTKIFLLSDEL